MTDQDSNAAIRVAVQHHKAGRLAEAETVYRQILACDPNDPQALRLLGVIACQMGHLDAGITLFDRAVKADPKDAEAHANLGNALAQTGRTEAACTVYQRANELCADNAAILSNLGIVLKDLGRFDAAVAACRRAIELAPDFPDGYCNLANVLSKTGHFDQAVVSYEKAISLRPNYVNARVGLGIALREKGELDRSIACYEHAIQLNPNSAEAHFNLSRALLSRGDYSRGWAEYEWRARCKDNPKPPTFAQPAWNGEPIREKTILLHCEQGYGDALQFVRYVPLVAKLGARVILHCPPEVESLVRSVSGVEQVVTGAALPPFDLHRSLMSLPLLFSTTSDSIPATVPYLSVDDLRLEKWRPKLQSGDGHLKVGLAWAGNPKFDGDRTRSITLSHLAPLASIKSATFHSLQKGAAGAQTGTPPAGMELIDLAPDLNEFADTAAAMSFLDLIVTTDTSVPHLAGALGRPVWLMLEYVPDWRWLLVREDSPWYPSMRLFRQPSPGDWRSVINRVVDSLGEVNCSGRV
jgi:tetratricopeptide (TPR) repeat protein